MVTIPLIQKIAELFLILFTTALLVKLGVLKSGDSKAVSQVSLYFVTPCVIFNSFRKELTPQVQQGLVLAVCLAVLFQSIFMLLAFILKHVWKASEVERASIMFTNAGNLIIPIVSYVLGPEWVIYVSGYILVFNVLCWTYGLRMFDGGSKLDLKRVLLNPNILAVLAGLAMLVSGIRITGPIGIAFDDVSATIGPISMIITGLIVGSMSLKEMLANKRVWGVIFFRMIVGSGCAVLAAWLLGAAHMVPSGEQIVMISLLSAVAPSASNINQLAILYNKDAKYASAINVLTTVTCIVTVPLWVTVYQALV